jgi:hypothetical protein
VGNIDVLKGTDIGILRNNKERDKSTYTVETKPDGTVIETVQMDVKKTNKGLVDLQTQGVTLGNDAATVGMSKEVAKDVASLVGSTMGGEMAAVTTIQKGLSEIGNKSQNNNEPSKEMTDKLDTFRAMRELQLSEDAQKREQQKQAMINQEDQISRGL